MTELKNSFFSYRYVEDSESPLYLSKHCEVKTDCIGYAAQYLRETISGFGEGGAVLDVSLSIGIPKYVKQRAEHVFCEHNESYAIVTSTDKKVVSLYAVSHRGQIYAVSTLKQLVEKGELKENMILFDYPDMDLRGYRVFTPGREYLSTFKQMVDTLVYYKYNTIMIEVGGAMEYKHRPEINKNWEEYCKEISVSPDVSIRIQCLTYPWAKDSIHFDNGNGSYITQDEMKDIIQYCREREIDVIPEVPSLSHSDYIVRTYRELNERKEDEYPDTYCPSNPKTYEVLFDIIDEVIDVFEPKYLNIGHDEYYTSAKCELCKGKNPVDLYVNDIIKINDYLKTKNVMAFMWSDKMFAHIVGMEDGEPVPYGGAANPTVDIPALYECRGRVPKDITLLHWYWDLSPIEEEQDIYHQGYNMLFGNFGAARQDDYRKRAPMYHGGFVGNWGSLEEKYMQRNRQNFDLVTTAYVFWSGNYTDSERANLIEKTKRELYGRYKKSLGAHKIIEIDHTTDYKKDYCLFYDGVFIVDEDWLLGHHVVKYADGTEAKLPVIYGYNIRSSEVDCESEDAYQVNLRIDNLEPIGASYPYWKDGKVWYRTAYVNPHPEKDIASIDFISKEKEQINVIRKDVEL